MVPERAASIEKPRLAVGGVADEANLGGSMRVKGEPPPLVLRRLRIPMRFRVGMRPAGALSGAFATLPASSRLGAAGDLAFKITRGDALAVGDVVRK